MHDQECDKDETGESVPTYACGVAGVPVPEPRHEHADCQRAEQGVCDRESTARTAYSSNPQKAAKQPNGDVSALRHVDPHQGGERQAYKDVDEEHCGLDEHGHDATDDQTEVDPPPPVSSALGAGALRRLIAQSRYARIALSPRPVLQIAALTAIAIVAP